MIWLGVVATFLALYLVVDLTNEISQSQKEIAQLREEINQRAID